MNYILVDLEATCWEKGTSPARMEIIEIGAIRLEAGSWRSLDEFERFVRPVEEPHLSDFCRELTGIRQGDVDAAAEFGPVFDEFLHWIGEEPLTLCSWGAYDLRQFELDCRRHERPLPAELRNHLNVKQAFADWRGARPCGMKKALRILDLEMVGRHHRGIDDVRNIARICRRFLSEHLADRERA